MMAGGRTSIAEQLAATKVGTEVEPPKQTVQPRPSSSSSPSSQVNGSRQSEEKTGRLPSPSPVAEVTFFVPPTSTDPAERLAYCQGAILDAERQTEQATERIAQQYLLWVGEPYRIVRDEDLYRLAGYATFDAWGRALYGRSGDYMNKVIRVGPVVRALAPITRRQLKEDPLRPLVSVQRQYGDEAVRECWKAAESAGDLTKRGLLAAAITLGYRVELGPAAEAAAQPPRLEPVKLSVNRLKRLGATDPVRALALCQQMREELAALERDLTREQQDRTE
ncbi:hypothetical protein [Streptomyces sp. CB03238]|uniref:hypothetical protein n=1 Tax=Streptomyces sp. CB03238 TaxID=1907777 RepID=UPI00117F61EF|nr:hypothetical protein [Streptomyces sp. CB03238]